jgi:hypothetical protein
MAYVYVVTVWVILLVTAGEAVTVEVIVVLGVTVLQSYQTRAIDRASGMAQIRPSDDQNRILTLYSWQ